jgi:hypothetical protein
MLLVDPVPEVWRHQVTPKRILSLYGRTHEARLRPRLYTERIGSQLDCAVEHAFYRPKLTMMVTPAYPPSYARSFGLFHHAFYPNTHNPQCLLWVDSRPSVFD